MAPEKHIGRPPYEPTDADREKVRVLKADGMSHEAIAAALGIDEKTLRKHFLRDLEIGGAKVRAEVLMARYHSAKAGNVAAQNKLLERADAARADERRNPKEPRIGKKEEQQRAAERVGGKFAPPEPPKLVVNNP